MYTLQNLLKSQHRHVDPTIWKAENNKPIQLIFHFVYTDKKEKCEVSKYEVTYMDSLKNCKRSTEQPKV